MKKRPGETRNWLFIELLGGGVLALAVVTFLIFPHVWGQPIEWQTAYYSILALSLGAIVAAQVERRLDALKQQLDELLELQRKGDVNK